MGPHSSRRSSFPLLPSVLLAALAIALPGCFVPAWSQPGGYYGGRGSYGGYRPYYRGDDRGRYAPPRRIYVPDYQDDDDDDDDHHHHGNHGSDNWQRPDRHRDADAQRDQQRAEQRARQYDAEQQQRAQRYDAEQQQRAQQYDAKQQQRAQQYEAQQEQRERARKQKEQRDEERRQQEAAQAQAARPQWSQHRDRPGARGNGDASSSTEDSDD